MSEEIKISLLNECVGKISRGEYDGCTLLIKRIYSLSRKDVLKTFLLIAEDTVYGREHNSNSFRLKC